MQQQAAQRAAARRASYAKLSPLDPLYAGPQLGIQAQLVKRGSAPDVWTSLSPKTSPKWARKSMLSPPLSPSEESSAESLSDDEVITMEPISEGITAVEAPKVMRMPSVPEEEQLPQQVVTDKGLAYILKPLSGASLIGAAGADGTAPGSGQQPLVDFVLEAQAPSVDIPVVTGMESLSPSHTEPFCVKDPNTGEILEAVPAISIEDVQTNPCVFVGNDLSEPAVVYNPQTGEIKVAKPAEEIKDFIPDEPPSTEMLEEPEDVASSTPEQIITDKGLAYVLKPMTGASLTGKEGEDGTAPGASQPTREFIVALDSEPSQVPIIIGSKPIDKADGFKIQDPSTGETMVAVPATTANELQYEPTVYVTNPKEPVTVHYPDRNLAKTAYPVVDQDAATPPKVRKLDKQPSDHQLVTDKGPAFTLRPISAGNIDGQPGADNDAPGSVGFVVAVESETDSPPVVVGSIPVSLGKPVRIQDPRTGEITEAVPLTDAEELKDRPTVYITSPEEPAKIHYPESRQTKIAYPVTSQNEPIIPETTPEVFKKPSELQPKQRPDTFTPSEERELDTKLSDQQVITDKGPAFTLRPISAGSIDGQIGEDGDAPGSVGFVVAVESKPDCPPIVVGSIPVPHGKPVRIQDPRTREIVEAMPLTNADELCDKPIAFITNSEEPARIFYPESGQTKMAYPTSPQTGPILTESAPEVFKKPSKLESPEMQQPKLVPDQIVTDKGPVYLLKPVDPSKDGDTGVPEIAIHTEQLQILPEIIGQQPVSKSKPFRVHDPVTGQILLAEPVQNPNQLLKGPTAYVTDLHTPAKIFNPDADTGESVIPKTVPEVFKQPGHLEPKQMVTDKGPAYVLKPENSVDGMDTSQLPFVSVNPEQLSTVPEIVTLQPVSESRPFKVQDPKTGDILVAVPAQTNRQLQNEPSVYMSAPSAPVSIHYPNVNKVPISISDDSIVPQAISEVDKHPANLIPEQIVTEKGPAYTLEPVDPSALKENSIPVVAVIAEPLQSGPKVIGQEPISEDKSFRVQDPKSGQMLQGKPTTDKSQLQSMPSVYFPSPGVPGEMFYPDAEGKTVPTDEAVVPVITPEVFKRPWHPDQIVTDKGPAYVLKPVDPSDLKNTSVPFVSTTSEPLENRPQAVTKQPASEVKPFKVVDPKTGHVMQAEPAVDPNQLQTQPSAYVKDPNLPVQIYYPDENQMSKPPSSELSTDDPQQIVTDKGPAFVLTPVCPDDLNDTRFQVKPVNPKPLENPPKVLSYQPLSENKPFRIKDPNSGRMLRAEPAQNEQQLQSKPSAYVAHPNAPVQIYYPDVDQVPMLTSPDAVTPTQALEVFKHPYQLDIPEQVVTDKGPAYVLRPVNSSDLNDTGRPVVPVNSKPLENQPDILTKQPISVSKPFRIQDPKSGRLFEAEPALNPDQLQAQPSVYIPNTDRPAEIYYRDVDVERMLTSPDPVTPTETPEDYKQPSQLVKEQVVTTKGPAYVLKPVDPSTVDDSTVPIIPVNSKPLEECPQRLTEQPIHDFKPFRIQDPETGRILQAEPALNSNQLKKVPSVYISNPTMPLEIYYPDKTTDEPIVPGKMPEVFKRPIHLEPEQIVTDSGPAYVLKPIPSEDLNDTTVPCIPVESKPLQKLPEILASAPVTQRSPFRIQDPKSGEILQVEPAQNINQLQKEPSVFVPDNGKPAQVFYPDVQPLAETSASDEQVIPKKEPTSLKPSDGFVPTEQIVTDRGPAFVVEPATEISLKGLPFIAVDTEPLENLPIVESLQEAPEKPEFNIQDPQSGDVMKAQPAASVHDILTKPTVYLEDPEKPAVIYYPEAEVGPLEEETVVESPGSPMSEDTQTFEKALPQQVLTDKGWAYLLQPSTGASLTGAEGTDGSAPGGPQYVIADAATPRDLPSTFTVQASPDSKPFLIADPATGDILEAVPAQSINDLQGKPTAYVTNPKNPVTVCPAGDGAPRVAIPTTSNLLSPDDVDMKVDDFDTGRDTQPTRQQILTDKGLAFVLNPSTRKGTQDDVILPLVKDPIDSLPEVLRMEEVGDIKPFIVVHPVTDKQMEAVPTTNSEQLKTQPSAYFNSMNKPGVFFEPKTPAAIHPYSSPLSDLPSSARPEDDEVEEHISDQILTDKGWAFTLQPLSTDDTGVEGRVPHESKPAPEFVIATKGDPESRPCMATLQSAPEQLQPFRIQDPKSGDIMKAIPCTSEKELNTKPVALVTDQGDPVTVHFPESGETMTAYPNAKVTDADKNEEKTDGIPSEGSPFQQVFTDKGPAYVLKPIGDIEQSQGPLLVAQSKPLEQLPNVEDVKNVPERELFRILDPRTNEVLQAYPATTPKDLGQEPSAYIVEPDKKPVIHYPAEDRLPEESTKQPQLLTDRGLAFKQQPSRETGQPDDSISVPPVKTTDTPLASMPNITGTVLIADAKPLKVQDPRTGEIMEVVPVSNPAELMEDVPIVFVDDPMAPVSVYYPSTHTVHPDVAEVSQRPVKPAQVLTNKGFAYVLQPILEDDVEDLDTVSLKGKPLKKLPKIKGLEQVRDVKPLKVYDLKTNSVLKAVPIVKADDMTSHQPTAYVKDLNKPASVYYPPQETASLTDFPPKQQIVTDKGLAFVLKPVPQEEVSSAVDDPTDIESLKTLPLINVPDVLAVTAVADPKSFKLHDPLNEELMEAVPATRVSELEGIPTAYKSGPSEPVTVHYPKSKGTEEEDRRDELQPKKPHQVLTDKGWAYNLKPLGVAGSISGVDGQRGAAPGSDDFVALEDSYPDNLPEIMTLQKAPKSSQPLVVKDPQSDQLFKAVPCTHPDDIKKQLTLFLTEPNKPGIIHNPDTRQSQSAQPSHEAIDSEQELPMVEGEESDQPSHFERKPSKTAHPTPTLGGPAAKKSKLDTEAPESEEPCQHQLLTDKGLAYMLEPLSEDQVDLDGEFYQVVKDPLSKEPKVMSLQTVPKSKPLCFENPVTGEKMKAIPASDTKDIQGKPSAYMTHPQKPIELYFPMMADGATGVKLGEMPTDSGPSAKRAKFDNVAQRPIPAILVSKPEEQPEQHVLTDEGWAFVLNPADEDAGITTPWNESLVFNPESLSEIPSVVAAVQTKDKPKQFKLLNPDTGEVMNAIPAESANDLVGKPSAYRKGPEQPVKVFLPNEGYERPSILDDEASGHEADKEPIMQQIVTDKGPAFVLRPVEAGSLTGKKGEHGSAPGGADFVVALEGSEDELPTVIGLQSVPEEEPLVIQDPSTGEVMKAVPATSMEELKEEPTTYISDPNAPIIVHYPHSGETKAAYPSADIKVPTKTDVEDVDKGQQLVTDMGPAYVLKPFDHKDMGSPTPALPVHAEPLETIPTVIGVAPVPESNSYIVNDPKTNETLQAVPATFPEDLKQYPSVFIADPAKPGHIHYPVPESDIDSSEHPVEPEKEYIKPHILTDKGLAYVLKPIRQEKETDAMTDSTPPVPAESTPLPALPKVIALKDVPRSKPFHVQDPVTGQIMAAVPAEDVNDLTEQPTAYVENREKPVAIHHPVGSLPPEEYGKGAEAASEDLPVAQPDKGRDEKKAQAEAMPTQTTQAPHQQINTDKGLAYILKPIGPGDDTPKGPVLKTKKRPLNTQPNVIGVEAVPDVKPFKVKNPKTKQIMQAVPATNSDQLKELPSAYVSKPNKPVNIYYPKPAKKKSTEKPGAEKQCPQLMTDKGRVYTLSPLLEESDIEKQSLPVMAVQTQPLDHIPSPRGIANAPETQPLRVQDPRSGEPMVAVPTSDEDALPKQPCIFVDDINKPAVIHYPDSADSSDLVGGKPSDTTSLVSDKSTTPLDDIKEPIEQISTDKGPAYILKPVKKGDITGPVVVADKTPLAKRPQELEKLPLGEDGMEPGHGHEPFFVQDPNSGEILEAVPATNAKELDNFPTVYGKDLDKPMQLYYPKSGQDMSDDPKSEMQPKVPSELDAEDMEVDAEADSREMEPDVVPSDLPGEEESHCHLPSSEDTLQPNSNTEALDVSPKYGKGDDEPASYDVMLAKSMDQYDVYLEKAPIDPDTTEIPSTSRKDSLQPSLTTRDDQPESPEQVKPQLITDQGPAYVLTPMDDDTNSVNRKEDKPDYTVSDEAKPFNRPAVIGARTVPVAPIVVCDPKTGQTMVANPAENLDDLDKFPTAYLDDNRNEPMKVHDPKTGQIRTAYPEKQMKSSSGKTADSDESGEEMESQNADEMNREPNKSANVPFPQEELSKPGTDVATPTIPAKPEHQQINTDKGLAYVLTPCSPENLKQKTPTVPTKKHPLKHLPKITGLEVVPDKQPFKVKDPKSGKLMQAVPATNSDQLKEEPSVYVKDPNKPAAIHYPKDVKPKACDKPMEDGATSKEPSKPQLLTDEGKAYVLTHIPKDGNVSEDTSPIIALQTQPLENVPIVHGVVNAADTQPLRIKDPRSGEPMVAVPTSDENALQRQPCIFVDDINKPAVVHYPDSEDSSDLEPVQPSDTNSLESCKSTSPHDDTKEPVQQINTNKGPAYILKPTKEGDVSGPVVLADKTPLAKKPQELENLPSKKDEMEPEHTHEPFFVQDPSSGEILEAVPATNSEDLDNFPTAYGKDLDKPMQLYYPKPEQDMSDVPKSEMQPKVPSELDAEDMDVDTEAETKETKPDMVSSDLPGEEESDSHMLSSEDTLQPSSNTEALDVSPKYGKGDDEPKSFDVMLAKSMDQYDVYLEKSPIDTDAADIPSRSKEDTSQPAKPNHQQISTDNGLAYILKPCSPEDLKQKAPIIPTKKHPLKHLPKITGLEVVPDEQPFKVKDPKSGKLMQAVPASNSDQLKEEPSVYVKDPNKPVAIHYPKDVKPKASDKPMEDGATSKEPSKPQLLTDEGKAYVLTPIPKDGNVSEDTSPIIALQTQPLENVPIVHGVVNAADTQPLRIKDPRSGEPMVAVPTSDENALQRQPCIFVDDINKPAVVHYPDSEDSSDLEPVQPSDTNSLESCKSTSPHDDTKEPVQQINTNKGPAYILKPTKEGDISGPVVLADKIPLAKKPQELEKLPSKEDEMEPEHTHEPFFVQDPSSGEILEAVPAINSEDLDNFPSAYGKDLDKPMQLYYPKPEQDMSDDPKSEMQPKVPSELDAEDMDVDAEAETKETKPDMVSSDLPGEEESDSHMPSSEDTLQPNSNTEALDVSPKYGKGDDEPKSFDVMLAKSMDQYDVYLEKSPIDPNAADIPSRSKEDTVQLAKPKHQHINTDKGLAYILTPCSPDDLKQKAPIVSTNKHPLKHLPKVTGLEIVPDKQPFKVKDPKSGKLMQAVPATNSHQLKEEPSVYVKEPNKPAVIHYPKVVRPKASDKSMKDGATSKEPSKPQLLTDEGKAYVLTPAAKDGNVSEDTSPIIALQTQPLENVPSIHGVVNAADTQPLRIKDPRSGEPMVAIPTSDENALQKQPCIFVDDINKPAVVHYPDSADSDYVVAVQPCDAISLESGKPTTLVDDIEEPVEHINTDKGPAYILKPTKESDVTEPVVLADKAPLEKKPQELEKLPSEEDGMEPEHRHEPFFLQDPNSGEILEAVPATNSEDLDNFPTAYGKDPDKPMQLFYPKSGQDISDVHEDEKGQKMPSDLDAEVMDVDEPSHKQLLTDKGLAFTLKPLPKEADARSIPHLSLQSKPLTELPKPLEVLDKPDAKPYRVHDPRTGEPVLAVPTQDTKDLEEGSVFVDDINKPAAVYYTEEDLGRPDTDAAISNNPAKPDHQQINTDKGLAYVLTPCSPEDLKQKAPFVSTKKHPLKHLPKVTGLEVVPDKQPFKVKDRKSGKLMQAVPATNSDQLKEEPSVFVKEPNKPVAIHYPKIVRPKGSDQPIRDGTASEELSKPQLLTDEGKAYVLAPMPKDGSVSEDTSPVIALQTQPLENVPLVQGVVNTEDAQPLRVQDPRSGQSMMAVPTSDESALQKQPCIFVDDIKKPAVVHYPDSAESGEPVPVQPSDTTSLESGKSTTPLDDAKEPEKQINTDKGPAYILKPTQEEDVTGPVVLVDKTPLAEKPQELENLSTGRWNGTRTQA